MTQQPLFRVATAYTLSQYREYNRTVQRENGVYRRIWASLALYFAIGIALFILLGSWFSVPLFGALGVVNAWMTVRGLRRAETAQYQQEQLVGTVEYEFYEDRLDVRTSTTLSSNPYSGVTKVLESDRAFYIMFAPTSGAILPKEDCSADLEGFIRSHLRVSKLRKAGLMG